MTRTTVILIGLGLAAEILLGAYLLGERREAIAARSGAQTAARVPALALAPGQGLTPPHAMDPAARLAAILADRGSAAGIRLVTRPVAASDATGLTLLDIDATGPEPALRSFARATEHGPPLVRFLHWTIRPVSAGTLRLSARAAAPLAQPTASPLAGERIALHPYPDTGPGDASPLFAVDTATDAVPAGGGGDLPHLLGIVGRLSAPEAMVRDRTDSIRTIGIGAAIDGWTVAAITADRVRFRRGTEERTAVLPPQADAP